MRPDAAAGAYRAASLENAPPLKLVHLMYEGALRYLTEAQSSDPASPRFLERLQRAENVVCELRLALDPATSPGLTTQLEALYLFVESEIRRASLGRDTAPLPGAREVLTTLLSGWKSLEQRAEEA